MNRDDVIRMAREAGVYSGANERVFGSSLERFAQLVAAHEREECAKACDLVQSGQPTGIAAYVCGAAIRARGTA